jgi:hypothetical protein
MTQNSSPVAGGPGDFMTVRHLVLRGSQTEIGRALAREVRARSDWAPTAIDPLISRARRTWFERNWPQHHARENGIAAEFGVDADSGALLLDGLSALPAGAGCSAAWTPASAAPDGHARVGRNWDFFIQSREELFDMMAGRQTASAGAPPWASRPYVLTTIPDDGLASTVIAMSELDCCSEGINESGLVVVLLAAGFEDAAPEEAAGPQAGLNPMQIPRFLLETCENVEQAKVALLAAKQYDAGVPCHFLVADASGGAFLWERGAGDAEHILPASDGPFCVTNHLLHKYPDLADLPADTEGTFRTYERVRTLTGEVAGISSSGERLRGALDQVAFEGSQPGPWRTLWQTVFDLEERTMAIRFYLGDGQDGRLRQSDEVTFGPGADLRAGSVPVAVG